MPPHGWEQYTTWERKWNAALGTGNVSLFCRGGHWGKMSSQMLEKVLRIQSVLLTRLGAGGRGEKQPEAPAGPWEPHRPVPRSVSWQLKSQVHSPRHGQPSRRGTFVPALQARKPEAGEARRSGAERRAAFAGPGPCPPAACGRRCRGQG